jgi:hypothetical protein
MKSKHDPKRIPGEKHFLTGIAIKLDVGLQDLTPTA